MMSHRGFSEADTLIEKVSKEPPSRFIDDPSYNNIGFNFGKYMRTDFKSNESLYMMSYMMTNETEKKKEFVIFGTGNKSFLTIVSDIMMSTIYDEYTYGFNLVVGKVFRSDCLEKIKRLSSKLNVIVFLDTDFEKPPFHAYTPKMTLMTEAEVDKFLTELKITKLQMKKISKEDPYVKYFGFPKGSVVRIHRTPMIDGSLILHSLDYRLVVG